MPTVGNSTTPGHSFFFQGVNTPPNQVGSHFNMPSGGGLITALHAYFSTEANGTATCWLCIWDGSFNLLGSVPVSVAQGSNSVGGQAWHAGTLSTPIHLSSGQSFFLGFAVPEHNGFVTTDESSGSSVWNTDATPPGNLANVSTGHNAIGAFADYTPVSARVRRSGAWVQTGTIFVRRSGVWVQATRLQVRRSGAWVDAT